MDKHSRPGGQQIKELEIVCVVCCSLSGGVQIIVLSAGSSDKCLRWRCSDNCFECWGVEAV